MVDYRTDKYLYFKKQLELAKNSKEIEKNFPAFLETIDILANEEKFLAAYELFDAIKNSELLNKTYSQLETLYFILLHGIDKMPNYYVPKAYSSLLEVAKKTGWIKKSIPAFLRAVERISGVYQYTVFLSLINNIKDTDLWNKFQIQIETQFIALFNNLDSVRDKDKSTAFFILRDAARKTRWIEKHFSAIFESVEKITSYHKYWILKYLINSIKSTDLFNKYYSQIETQLLALLNKVSGSGNYRTLINAVDGTDLIRKHFPTFLKTIDRLSSYERRRAFYDLINPIKDIKLLNKYYSQIETQFLFFLETFDNSQDEEREYEEREYEERERKRIAKYLAFSDLLKIVKEKDWVEELFPAFLDNIDRLPSRAFSDLIETTKEKGLIEVFFPIFFETIDKIDGDRREYAFNALIKVWRELGLPKKYFLDFVNVIDYSFFRLVEIAEEMGLMKEFFPVLSRAIDKINNGSVKYDAFSKLLNVAEQKRLTPDYFPVLLESVKMLGWYKYQFFFESCDTARRMGLMKNYYADIKRLFLTLVGDMNTLNDKNKFDAFSYLLSGIEGSELTDELYSLIETQFFDLIVIYNNFNKADKETAFYSLDRLPMNTKLMQNHFPVLLGVIDKLHDYTKYYAFYCLLGSIKDTNLFDVYFSHIEKFYLDLLNNINELTIEESQKAIHRMIEVFKSNEIWSKYFSLIRTKYIAIINQFDKLPDSTQKLEYYSLISVIEDTDLENDIAVKKWKEKYESNN